MSDFRELLRLLSESHVEFILVGGMAATVHGSSRLTEDLDVVYRRTPDNIARLVRCLSSINPYLRGAPPGLPFLWDEQTIQRGMNFTLTTNWGAIDLLGEITGGGTFDELLPHCISIQVFGVECRCLGLERLIHVKRAAGRPKDLEVVAELESLRDDFRGGSMPD